jgi:hypothetical protein
MKAADIWKAGLGTFVGGIVSTMANIAIFFINREVHNDLTVAGFNPSAFLWLGGAAGSLVGGIFAARSADKPEVQPSPAVQLASAVVHLPPSGDVPDIADIRSLANALVEYKQLSNLLEKTHEDIGDEYLERVRGLIKLQRMLDETRVLNKVVLEDLKAAAQIAKIDPNAPSVALLMDYIRAQREAAKAGAPNSVSYPVTNRNVMLVPGPHDPAPVSAHTEEPVRDRDPGLFKIKS